MNPVREASSVPAKEDRIGHPGVAEHRRRALLRRARRVAAGAASVAAGALVLLVLVAPTGTNPAPLAFLRIPVEGLLGVGLLLVVPARARTGVAAAAGVALGLLAIVKVADVGFLSVLGRPFDPVFDWPFLASAAVFVSQSAGRADAITSVVVAVVLAVGALALMSLSVMHLSRLLARHRGLAARGVTLLGVAWLACAVSGVALAPGVPIAAHTYYDRLVQVSAALRDPAEFAAQLATDPLRAADWPLTALRGKDVVFVFVESYGRVAVADSLLAPQIDAVLAVADRRLRAAGFGSRSAYLTSPTVGGGSWLAHATLQCGVWVSSQRRYDVLLGSDRFCLSGAFGRAGWRTVAVMPGLTGAWPEGRFYGYDRVYGAGDLGYRGPRFAFATMPDQFTLSAFQRTERAGRDRVPVMAEIPLTSSHAPWTPVPDLVEWDDLGDGSSFEASDEHRDPPEMVLQRDPGRVRADYEHAIEYSLKTLMSYVEKYGDEDLVLVFLGDHQPAPVVTGTGAGRDVPVTIVARDPAVLDRISGWGWQDGLNPGPHAPVWPMDAFRDRFLRAFAW